MTSENTSLLVLAVSSKCFSLLFGCKFRFLGSIACYAIQKAGTFLSLKVNRLLFENRNNGLRILSAAAVRWFMEVQ